MNLVQKTILAAVAAGALLGAAAAPAAAFPVAAPGAATSPNINHVWYDRWGNWHPNRGYWGPRPYWGPRHYWGGGYRHCWINPWGHRVCRW